MDLVQDALVRAYRGITGFDGRYPRAWLLTIVRNTYLNRLRRRRPELRDDPDVDLDRVARHTKESTVEAIDAPIGTVMSRLHRAGKRMREDHLVRAGIGPGRSRR